MTTRSNNKNLVLPIKQDLIQKRVENSWVILIKDSLFETGSFNIITLPHPALKKAAKYCLDDVQKKIYEIITFSEPYRSWFIDETVKSDGSILMATPVNPVFLVLPRLKAHCKTQAIPLEDLLSEKGFNKILNFITTLDHVADLKGPKDLRAYKYNETKTIKWLEEKVHKLAKVLREKKVHVASGAVSATFVTSNLDNDSVDEEFYLKYACGIISEYLDEELAESLEKQFKFKPDLIESIGKKRKSNISESDNKKIKLESNSDECKNEFNISEGNIFENKKQKPLSAKEKARQKAANGTKTISSFFVKKNCS